MNEFIYELENIQGMKNQNYPKTRVDLVLLQIQNWCVKYYDFLKNSFDMPNNIFTRQFNSVKNFFFSFDLTKSLSKPEFEDIIQRLSAEKMNLVLNLRYLCVSDAIIQHNFVDFSIRISYTPKESFDLLMDKLYHLYDDQYYSMHVILKGNAINMKRNDEFKALIEKCVIDGYINLKSTDSNYVQLTESGKEMIEKRRTFISIIKSAFSNDVISEVEQIDLYGDTHSV
jgi:hypothetical protein